MSSAANAWKVKAYNKLQVINGLGQVVVQQNISGEVNINLQQLPAGVYTLSLNGDNVAAHAEKIVKE